MNRRALLAAAALVAILLAALGLSLLRDDSKDGKNDTPGPRNRSTVAWTLPPLPQEKPARPTEPAKLDLPATKPPANAIAGSVRDTHGAPIAGATVRLLADEKCSVRTGADGAFTLVPSLEGKKLILVAEGPAPLAARVVPGIAPGTTGLVIVLRAGEATVSGRVLRSKDRKAVSAAKIEAQTADWLGRATTDAEGRFTLAGAPSGGLGLVVSAEGLIARVVTINARRGGSTDVEIVLESGCTLAGTVVSKGAPVAGAKVVLRQGGVPLPFERRETKSDAKGRFAFEGIPAAEIRLHARTEQGVSQTAIVRSDGARDPDPVVLELGPGGFVVGRVSSGGAPVVGARLTLKDEDAPTPLAATSDERGRFELGPVPQKVSFELRAEAKGFARKKTRVQADEPFDLVLARAACLAITTSPQASEIDVVGPDNDRRLLQWGGLLDDLAPGATWVVAREPGRAPASRRVELREGETTRLDIDLKTGRTLEGTCQGDDGAPVVGASVNAVDPDSGPLAAGSNAVTDASGHFALADVGPGKHRLHATAAGYLEAEGASDGEPTTLVLARSYALEVQVTAPPPARTGDPDAHTGQLLVRVAPAEGNDPAEQRVLQAPSGSSSTVFERLRGAVYHVTVLSPGLAPASTDVDLRAQATATLTLAAGAPASGIVVDPDGNPLPGAALTRGHNPDEDLLHEGSFATVLTLTEAKGDFECAIDPAGEDVTVSHPDFAPLFTHLAPGGGTKLTLSPGARITGRALGKDGKPQANVGISLDGPEKKRTQSAADGTFTFKGLLAGTYRVKRHDTRPDDPGVEVTVGNRGETGVELKSP